MRARAAAFVLLVSLAACTDPAPETAPTAVAGPTPVAPIPALPTSVPGVLTINLPVDPVDLATTSLGMLPFGVHSPGHAAQGHTGWDFEIRQGASIRAAAAGTILNVVSDQASGRHTVEIEHLIDRHYYRTIYTGLASLAADISRGEVVRVGQTLGSVAGVSHFQLDDFEYYREISSPNAVSPEPFLSAASRSQLNAIWTRAAYSEELIEPFITNPRQLAFPASRTWLRAGGDGSPGYRFTRADAGSRATAYQYALLSESGVTIEAGTATIDAAARPYATIDFLSATAVRRGLFDIVSNEMRLAVAPHGSARPTDLAGASVYRTK